MKARLTLTLAIMLVVPWSLALAQRGMGGRRGGGGGRGGNSSDESSLVIPEPVNPVMLLIQHSRELALDTSQLRRVVALKRGLDSANTPYLRRLDSLQDVLRKGASRADGGTPASGPRALIALTNGKIRENIDPARETAYHLLSEAQLEKAKALESEADKKYQEQLKAVTEPGARRGGAPPPQ